MAASLDLPTLCRSSEDCRIIVQQHYRVDGEVQYLVKFGDPVLTVVMSEQYIPQYALDAWHQMHPR